MGSIFAAGLLFKSDLNPGRTCHGEEPGSDKAPQGTGNSSPFVTIFDDAKVQVVSSIISISHIARVLMCSIAA
jgi:hypothetical protein